MRDISKYLIFCAITAGLIHTSAGTAAAADNTGYFNSGYVGISGDLTWPSHSDMGGGGRIVAGSTFNPMGMGSFRGELEAGYHKADGDSGFGDLRYFNYMANAYYDFSGSPRTKSSERWGINPYVGGGLGMASIREGQGSFGSTLRHHTNAFAYQGMAGLTFTSASAPNMEWLLGYRYLNSSREDGIEIQAHNMEVGLRYHF